MRGKLTIAKKWKQAQCASRDKWIRKLWYICMYDGILFSLRKEILTHAQNVHNVHNEDIMLSEISQSQQTLHDSTYMRYLQFSKS